MRQPTDFFDQWHTLVIHAKVVPRLESEPLGNEVGFIEGFLNDAPFQKVAYGLTPDAKSNPYEPFGYPSLKGCTYFKFGLYGDHGMQEWSVLVDRFRRGSSRSDVQ